MKTKLLALVLLAGGSIFAQTRFSFGVTVGGRGPGYYQAAPSYAYAVPPSPGAGYIWVDGYWAGRSWVAGYWARPRYEAPRYDNRYSVGYGRQVYDRGYGRGDRKHDRDQRYRQDYGRGNGYGNGFRGR